MANTSDRKPPKSIEVSEDSKITIKVKDAIAIASFLIYVGISVAGYFFARNKLDQLEETNKELQKQVLSLESEYKASREILDRVEKQVNNVNDFLMKKGK